MKNITYMFRWLFLVLMCCGALPVLAVSGIDDGPASYCMRQSYGRGVGTVPDQCAGNKFKAGALCYSNCPAGMKPAPASGDCHSICPDGMRDDGLFCRKAEYGRGAGYADWDRDKCEREQKDEAGGAFERIAGVARDIGVGANGTAWVIGTARTAGGFEIFRLDNNGNWNRVNGGALRIDVERNGNAWVVNENNDIWRWNGTAFEQLPGKARDIGVGANGGVWVIGTNQVPGGFGIFRWNGKGWDGVQGGAVRIDVDPAGNAWIVNEGGDIWRWKGNSFEQLPGKARDIGIAGNGDVFVTALDYKVYRWAGNAWIQVQGLLSEISGGSSGLIWGVTQNGEIWRQPERCEKSGAIWYPKCKPGYSAFGSNICRPPQPDCAALGLNPGTDLSCAKKIQLGKPELMDCPSDKQKDGGLCYSACKNGYAGNGPVCWALCPSKRPVSCGFACVEKASDCPISAVFDNDNKYCDLPASGS